jgi:hypothetical protein
MDNNQFVKTFRSLSKLATLFFFHILKAYTENRGIILLFLNLGCRVVTFTPLPLYLLGKNSQ